MTHHGRKLKRTLGCLIFTGVVLSTQAASETQDAVGLPAPGCDPGVQTLAAPITAADVIEADFGKAQAWGGASNVVSIKHLYLSEQPDKATLVEARDHGVGVVINLLEPFELYWDEAAATNSLGLTYYNVPIAATGTSFDTASMKKISALVGKHKNTKILIHGSSANRASAWLAIHLAQDHAIDVETSISLARKAGLTKPVIETRVRNYLNYAEKLPQQSD